MARSGTKSAVGRPASPGARDTREALVRAAVAALIEEGFAGASAREIARRAGCNQGLVFYHFGSVANLLLAALDEVSETRRVRYQAAVDRADGIGELVDAAAAVFEEDLDAGHMAVLAEMIAGASSTPGLGRRGRGTDRPVAPVHGGGAARRPGHITAGGPGRARRCGSRRRGALPRARAVGASRGRSHAGPRPLRAGPSARRPRRDVRGPTGARGTPARGGDMTQAGAVEHEEAGVSDFPARWVRRRDRSIQLFGVRHRQCPRVLRTPGAHVDGPSRAGPPRCRPRTSARSTSTTCWG